MQMHCGGAPGPALRISGNVYRPIDKPGTVALYSPSNHLDKAAMPVRRMWRSNESREKRS